MNATSQIVSALPHGLILDVQIEDLTFTAYVVISEPDLDRIADFVTQETYEQANDWHVAAVSSAEEAQTQVTDIAFNMNLDDAAVFLCADTPTYEATLQALGQPEQAQGVQVVNPI